MTTSAQAELQSVAKIIQGGRHKLSGNHFVTEGGFPAYGAGGLNGYLPMAEFNRAAVILSSIGARCGKCFFATGEWSSLANTQVILPDEDKVDPLFLWYQLNDEKRWPRAGVAQPFIKPSDVKCHKIILPPLDEQKRIAAILDQADELRRKRQRAIDRLNHLGQAIFCEMFGRPNRPRAGIPLQTIAEIAECLDAQRRPVKAFDRPAGDVPYYGANGQQGWIDRPIFNESLVLVAEDGGHFSSPERGVAYRIDGPSWVNNHAHILRAKMGIVTTEYLHYALRNFDFTRYISGSTRSKLTKAQLMQCEVATPDYEQQIQFDRHIAYLNEITAQSCAQFELANSLFASLQHRGFRGEL